MGFPFDQSFKVFADEDPRALLALFSGIGLDADVRVEPLDREVNVAAKRVDHACLVDTGAGAWVYHFEAISRFRSDVLETQYWYIHDLAGKHRKPIVSHLLLLTESGVPPSLSGELAVDLGRFQARAQVEIVRLWQIPATSALRLRRPAVDAWIPLLDATAAEIQEAARRIALSRNRELALRMAILGGLRYGNKEAFLERLEMIVLTDEVLQDSVFYQMILEKGEERGVRKGMEHGREQGRLEGERSLLQRQLVMRFGELPEWAQTRLANASTTDLERWAAQVLTAPGLHEALL